jgi:hypothetical protein
MRKFVNFSAFEQIGLQNNIRPNNLYLGIIFLENVPKLQCFFCNARNLKGSPGMSICLND